MHPSSSLTFIIVLAVSGMVLSPARADDTTIPPAAETVAAAIDAAAASLAIPDGTTALVEPDPADAGARPRWFERLVPQNHRQALIVQPLLGGQLSSTFGMRRHPVLGTTETHDGVDWSAPSGTYVFAAADGTVSFAGWDNGYGNTVRIIHSDGVETVYAHLRRIETGVDVGDIVIQGYVIGQVGSTGMTTGPNLHFEVHVNGAPVDPLGTGTTLLVAAVDRPMLARLRAQ